MFEVTRERRKTLRGTDVCYFLMRCDGRHSRCVARPRLFLRAIAKWTSTRERPANVLTVVSSLRKKYCFENELHA